MNLQCIYESIQLMINSSQLNIGSFKNNHHVGNVFHNFGEHVNYLFMKILNSLGKRLRPRSFEGLN
jgi:hypothetical protein